MSVLALTRTEVRLLTRDWALLVFAFAFPPITMLIIAGSFGTEPSPEFNDLEPAAFYVASYLAVPIAAIALIGLPVAMAGYRERDVMRRFEAFGVPAANVISAQAAVSALLVALGAVVVMATAAPVYGVPAVQRPAELAAGLVAGTATMLLIGVALGLALPSARGAQAIGLMLFFPMFLLSGGGPPPEVMGPTMERLSMVLPMTHVTGAIRDPWLDDGSIGPHLTGLAVWVALAAVAIVTLRRRATGSASA